MNKLFKFATLTFASITIVTAAVTDPEPDAAQFVDEAVRLLGKILPDNAKKQAKPMHHSQYTGYTDVSNPQSVDYLYTVSSIMGDIWCVVDTERRKPTVLSVQRFYHYRDDLENITVFLDANGWKPEEENTQIGVAGFANGRIGEYSGGKIYRKDGVQITFTEIYRAPNNKTAPLGIVNFRPIKETKTETPKPIGKAPVKNVPDGEAPDGGNPGGNPSDDSPKNRPAIPLQQPPSERKVEIVKVRCHICKGDKVCQVCKGEKLPSMGWCPSCFNANKCKYCKGKGEIEQPYEQ